MKKLCFLSVWLLCLATARAQADQDRRQVERAALDYMEAFYEADTAKAVRSVAPDFSKRGFYRNNQGQYVELKMSYPQLISLAQRWNKSVTINAQTPKKVTIFEVTDKTASVRVDAHWGMDYLHLAKMDNGSWKIVNVLWQSAPPER